MCVILSVAALLTSAAGCSRKSNKNEKVLKQIINNPDSYPQLSFAEFNTLINGKNDSIAQADALAHLLKNGMNATCHVNLILLNEVAETGFRTAARRNAEAFRDELLRCGVNATIRRRLGGDINASCGQLRLRRAGT